MQYSCKDKDKQNTTINNYVAKAVECVVLEK